MKRTHENDVIGNGIFSSWHFALKSVKGILTLLFEGVSVNESNTEVRDREWRGGAVSVLQREDSKRSSLPS